MPDCSAQALLDSAEDWLAPHLIDLRSLDALGGEGLHRALRVRLDHAQYETLQREAPARLQVPSGRELALDYTDPAAPALAVKLQELFGLAQTPCVARGMVPVTLHLLAPNGRPIQVTRDLRGFWDRTYAEVKKELEGPLSQAPVAGRSVARGAHASRQAARRVIPGYLRTSPSGTCQRPARHGLQLFKQPEAASLVISAKERIQKL
ncbi:ATP-dependent helicase hrpb [mine drainage metagenome]|uniref:ATP-dependent helicase hrpb n=1 Tax=mine drainage metagenome TaxID=410659 RepID=T1CX98_9ZZZZ